MIIMKVVIVRTSNLILDFKTYNCQELGLAKALSRRGYKMSIITPDLKASHYQEVVDGGTPVDIYTVTFHALNRNICWHHGVIELLKEISPDLIHINSISLSMSYCYQLWAEKNKVKTVVIQGNYETTQKPILKQLETLYNSTFGRSLIKKTNGIAGKTNWACDFIKRYYHRETMLTHIGLDTERFENAKNRDWDTELQIKDKKKLIYVGALESRRNPLFLAEIMTKLPEDYVLIIVGAGPQGEELKSYIASMNLSKRILMLGKLSQEDLPSLYKSGDLFLLATNYEIFGMVLLESMYFGLPVVSTLSAGSDTIINNGIDGVIITELNSSVWAKTILEIVENPDRLNAMKHSAATHIREHLVWERSVDEFLTLYEKALSDDK